MFSSNFTDQNITKHLNQKLSGLVDSKYKCISNSIIVQSQSSSFLAYAAKNLNKQLVLIKVQLSSCQNDLQKQQQPLKQIVQAITIQSKDQLLLLNDNLFIQLKPSPYMKQALAICVYDMNQSQVSKNNIKGLFLASFKLEQINQLSQNIKLINCFDKKRQGSYIKDVKWHPYAPLTLLILTTDRILVYKLDKNPYEPDFQLTFKEIKVKNNDEVIVKDYFEKIQFAQSLNEEKTYSSLGKKFSLYAISNTGALYLFFPFICTQTIIDKAQHDILTRIFKSPSSDRQIQMLKMLQNASINQIKQNDQRPDQSIQQLKYSLQLGAESLSDPQLFHLKNLQQTRRESSFIVRRPFQSIEDFHVVTLNRHTIFISAMKTKQLSGIMKIQTFSEDPYNRLIHGSKYQGLPANLNIQTVGELRVDKSQVPSTQNSSKLRVLHAGNSLSNEIYLISNSKVCYKINMDGLVKVIRSSFHKEDAYNVPKVIEVDVIFQSKSKILTLSNKQRTIYLLRHTNSKGYTFVSIPLQSIWLRQQIRQTSQQTQNLFQSLIKNAQQKVQNMGKPKSAVTVDLPPLSQSTCSQLQGRLSQFISEFKSQIQTKLNNIRILYSEINHKNSTISEHNMKKTQLLRLIQKAQQNDMQIKRLITNPQKQRTAKQKDIESRINAVGKHLDELKYKLVKQCYNVKVDPIKKQGIKQCEKQTDAVIIRLSDIRERLIKKKKELKREMEQINIFQ